MTEPNDTDAIVAECPGVECPLCHREVHHALEDHLEDRHTTSELVAFVANFTLERETTGRSS